MKTKLNNIEKHCDFSIDPVAINLLVAIGIIHKGNDADRFDYVLADKYAKKNWAICTRCRTFLLSEHVHDFVKCECQDDKYIFIDGGDDYRRAGGEPDQFYKK